MIKYPKILISQKQHYSSKSLGNLGMNNLPLEITLTQWFYNAYKYFIFSCLDLNVSSYDLMQQEVPTVKTMNELFTNLVVNNKIK